MKDKQYISITAVSKLLNINAHVIRYWDSKFEGISTRLSDNKRRFFNNSNIKKLSELKKILYQNGKHNYSLNLANKMLNKRDHKIENHDQYVHNIENKNNHLNISELKKISNNLKKLLEF